MKIYISTDMEGVSGIVSWEDMQNNSKIWNEMLATEIKWIMEGLDKYLEKEVEEVVICDSHSRGENLPYELIDDRRIKLIRGYPRPMYMMEGLNQKFFARRHGPFIFFFLNIQRTNQR